jgi:saccharopine dehydrogenase (NAD+, L-lysine-forming)
MRILLIGVGGVGEAIAVMAKSRPWVEELILTDYNIDRVREVQARLGNPVRFPAIFVDATKPEQIETLARQHEVDLIMNACAPSLNEPIFEAAYRAGCHYMDMAMTLSSPHPQDPFNQVGIKLGDYQFERSHAWERNGRLALVGMGVEPGMVDVFARYAQDYLFDEIEEVGVRDGANLEVRGYEFAPNFSIWSTIEECLNPPVIWEKERGWYTTPPFSEPEVFQFPDEIGPVECVNVEHEEVLLIPRWVQCKRVTFKYGLGDQFISTLKTLHTLGLDSKDPVKVRDISVAPRDVVAACLPDPAHLGDRMFGQTCAGLWVTGWKDGKRREVYLYQVADNETCMRQFGCQAVVAQTAFNAVLARRRLTRSHSWSV